MSCIPEINRSRESAIVLHPSESRRIVKCAVNRNRTMFKHIVYGITCIGSRMNRQSHLMHQKLKSCCVYRKSNTSPITQCTLEIIKRIINRITYIGSQMHRKSLADCLNITLIISCASKVKLIANHVTYIGCQMHRQS